ncbi:SDR family oxidoreductase [Glycomyces harbinensis]|uniref:Uncharacterized conserved protein YbjT, contains NAD(P)-binding and DUF2867 domains n=1 Tax=Glycomyces harbinensis TaxID=58114 RepID=A0A1G7C1B7_9ACTN|nr:NAD(P)H-binding protein [Glycomyces harbinensis]SDE33069.1 Uncharacterized conserved protein YbjT, contains NAD(P)-binding and DUF2867 domains [Glycomyces harbinensis]
MIVVTGATGNTGRPLVDALLAKGEDVTAVSRGEAEFPAGARHRRADLYEPASLESAFAGADRLYLITHDHELDIAAVVKAAQTAGIGRIVLLSSQRVATRPHERLSGHEDAVTASGLEWTILRPGGFASNALLGAAPVREQRKLIAPFGDVGLPLIDPLDIAETAAAALTEDGHQGKAYTLTGPALVTPRQQAEAVAAAIGEPVEFVEQTRAQAHAQLVQFWADEIVAGTLDVIGDPNEAEQAISPDVERVLGRSPHTFAAWAERNAAAFR